MKNVSIEIGSVTVHGVPRSVRNTEALGCGIERAFGHLIATRGLPAELGSSNVASVTLPDLRLPPNASERQVAEAVAAALAGVVRRR